MNKINLEDLAGGALQEKASMALEKVMKNLQDPNTPWKNKRAVMIKLTFEQNEERDDATCDISVDTKLAPVKPVETKFSIAKDLKTGEVEAVEYGPQIKGQMAFRELKENEAEVDGKIVDTETGEIKENVIRMAR